MMVGFDGNDLDDTLKYYIEKLKVGGLILFARNLVSPDQIETLCHNVQVFAFQCGQPPLFIGIDQEGGVVARLKPPFTQFAGNPFMKTVDEAVQFARVTASELNRIGVNMNMSPVLDVLPPQGPSVMETRAFVGGPDRVAQMGASIVKHLQQNGIMSVAKHFPGIGRTVLDSHEDLPDLDIDEANLTSRDLIPFRTAIETHVTGIMLSHIRYRRLDPIWPASLSVNIAGSLLRDKMGFSGLVLTDDLDMGAISKHYDGHAIVQQCLKAKVDILMICHPGPKIERTFNDILKSIKTNEEISKESSHSLERIMDTKKMFLSNKP